MAPAASPPAAQTAATRAFQSQRLQAEDGARQEREGNDAARLPLLLQTKPEALGLSEMYHVL